MDINKIENDVLNVEHVKIWKPVIFENVIYLNGNLELSNGMDVYCDFEVEKMSKSKYNVQTPDDLVEKFGADTLRCYEMFLGPVEQSKPWDTKGINGVHNFLRKLTRLFMDKEENFLVTEDAPSKDSMKTLHKTIKKVTEDLNRFSWNTVVS
ncbi:MAG: class I tRNA ligase family protein [Flavobacteriales bacterium]